MHNTPQVDDGLCFSHPTRRRGKILEIGSKDPASVKTLPDPKTPLRSPTGPVKSFRAIAR